MWKKTTWSRLLLLLACGVAIATLAGCEPDYREAGRRAGDLAQEAGGTVAAEVEERAPTVAAEVEERAPTVAAGAATAARDFSEGVRDSGVCSGAAMVVLGAGLVAAVVQGRR
jgi:hypothetical protein